MVPVVLLSEMGLSEILVSVIMMAEVIMPGSGLAQVGGPVRIEVPVTPVLHRVEPGRRRVGLTDLSHLLRAQVGAVGLRLGGEAAQDDPPRQQAGHDAFRPDFHSSILRFGQEIQR